MAVTIAAQALADEVGTDLDTGTRYLGVATALHDRYVGTATIPDAVSNEAAILCAGHLIQHTHGGIRGERAGDVEVTYAPSMLSALRHSGAMALLSPFKRRRAR